MSKPRRVDFLAHREDLMAAALGSLGFTTDFIVSRTKLTKSQVLYRLKLAAVKRSEFRSGGSEMAKVVLALATAKSAAKVRDWAAVQSRKSAQQPPKRVPA